MERETAARVRLGKPELNANAIADVEAGVPQPRYPPTRQTTEHRNRDEVRDEVRAAERLYRSTRARAASGGCRFPARCGAGTSRTAAGGPERSWRCFAVAAVANGW